MRKKKNRKFDEFLDKSKSSYKAPESDNPEQYNRPQRFHRPHVRVPRVNLKRILKRISVWYGIYFLLIVFLNYLITYNKEIYFAIIPFVQYPFYLLSAFLGGYIPYKLFKKYEYKSINSDLQIWALKGLAVLVSIGAAFVLLFGMLFFISSLVSAVGKEIGYGISIFLGVLFLGVMLFSAYLVFKYQIRSGVIIHRGMGWN